MKRSKHSLSHYNLLTAPYGSLIPLTWYEALPGDSIQQATSLLVRVSPLLAPVMHPVRVRIHHWFVPNRLIWEDWEDFITGGPDGTFQAAVPKILQQTIDEKSIHDYMGIPPGDYGATPTGFSALPFRAYLRIWSDHYRDQDLIEEPTHAVASGEDATSYGLKQVAWEKDYFTTARPWSSKGNEITIPVGDKAPVTGIGASTETWASGPISTIETGETELTQKQSSYKYTNTAGVDHQIIMRNDEDQANAPGIYADLSQATGITVNQLREALAFQRYQEARAQYGSRYVEYLRYLGVRSSDARLQNPEYLGGGRQIIQFSEVLQTQRTDTGESPLGSMAGHGIAAMRTNRFRRFFEEHGIVMTLMSVVPKSIYMQAEHKKWSRLNKEDYFQKELQYLGDQIVYNREIYPLHTTPLGTFGYQQRYDEYRHHPSLVAGEFNSTLNHWHYGRDFQADPALNESFISAVPTTRVHADTASDPLWIMANHSVQARRMLIRTASPRTF